MKKFDEKIIMNTTKEIILNKTKEISLDEINPYIRRASKHVIQGGLNTGIRINIHYQLHYIVKGKGRFSINKQIYNVSKGDFLIWCPGEVHSIISDEKDPLQVIGVQFDFTRNYCSIDYPCIHFNESSFSWDMVNEVVNIKELDELTACTKVLEQTLVKNYLEDVVRIFESSSAYSQHILSGLLKSIIILVLEGNINNDEKFKIKKLVIKDLLTYINEHHPEKLTNTLLGDTFGYHPNHLNQMFLTQTGYTIQQYIIHIRMNKAIDLLVHTNQTISEIGNLVGGYSIHYFSRLFKNKTGLTPSAFRNG